MKMNQDSIRRQRGGVGEGGVIGSCCWKRVVCEGVGGSATRVWGGGGGGEEEGEEEGEGRSVGDSGQPCHFLSF